MSIQTFQINLIITQIQTNNYNFLFFHPLKIIILYSFEKVWREKKALRKSLKIYYSLSIYELMSISSCIKYYWKINISQKNFIRKIINDKDKSYNLYFYANIHFIFLSIKFQWNWNLLKTIIIGLDVEVCVMEIHLQQFLDYCQKMFSLLISNEILHMKEFKLLELLWNLLIKYCFFFISGFILFYSIKNVNICINCDLTWSYCSLSCIGSSGKILFFAIK